jgi:PD-(D/E)XK endonuclease
VSIIRANFTTNSIGEKSQAAILAEIVKNGYTVLLPFGEARRYDMVFEKSNIFFRVQCKTGRYMNGVIRFNTCSVNWWNKTRKKYTSEEIDYFAVYCQYTEKVYLIPVEEVAANEGYLRVEPTANNQEKGIRWAQDYEI